jgi:hypothetical protein
LPLAVREPLLCVFFRTLSVKGMQQEPQSGKSGWRFSWDGWFRLMLLSTGGEGEQKSHHRTVNGAAPPRRGEGAGSGRALAKITKRAA